MNLSLSLFSPTWPNLLLRKHPEFNVKAPNIWT